MIHKIFIYLPLGSGGEQGRIAGDDYARRRKDYQFERRVCYLFSLYNHLLSFSRSRLSINDDIDAIIQRGEERTIELNSKYEGLNLEDLSNLKSEASRGEMFTVWFTNISRSLF